jgi:hypothetical protein
MDRGEFSLGVVMMVFHGGNFAAFFKSMGNLLLGIRLLGRLMGFEGQAPEKL